MSVDPPGVPARRAALRLLDAVLRRGLPLEAALGTATRGLDRPEDRALAHNLAATVLRWQVDLDALIDSATRNRLADDAKARMALRLALAGTLVLGTPPHAAIATVLPLVDGGPRRLVHGVFGTLDKRGARLPETPTLPDLFALRWAMNWGDEMVAAAGTALAAPPMLDLTLADDEGLAPEGTRLAPRNRRIAPASVPALPGFTEGGWWVQDLASSLPARLLGPGQGAHVLDLCAAPGGKAMQLAAAGWRVTAVDASPARLERLRENLARTRLDVELVEADLMQWGPPAPADAVLLDAPCSATGVFRRHPDVLHRVRPKDIAALAVTQAAMLDRAAGWVRPGGSLVYAVCSLEPQEGEAQVAAFLDRTPGWRIAAPEAGTLPTGLAATSEGWVRTLPGMLVEQGGLDGFFTVRMVREG